jgi:hypothetical protein
VLVRRLFAARFALPTLALLGLGCDTTPPGEVVGTFEITMKLEENTCGDQAVIITDGRMFAAELRKDDAGRAYWRVPDQKIVDGSYEDDTYRFVAAGIVASSKPGETPQCSIHQTAVLEAEVDVEPAGDAGVDEDRDAGADAGAGATELVLEGDYTLSIEQAAGTDCSGALAPAGPFKTLPCTVRYDVTGTERESLD